jgi:hypothetical protein
MNENDSTTEEPQMEDQNPNKHNWKTLIAVALVSIVAAVGVTLAVTSGDDDDDDDTAEIAQTASPADDGTSAPVDDDTVVDPDDVGESPEQVIDPDDQPISQGDQNRVSKAALDIAGGGAVTDLDRSDDPGEAWEVEVTLEDGSELDVALDENLNRVENQPYDD